MLDLSLPRLDGLELCRRLRADHGRRTPILMLTARDAVEQRVAGLRAGADDYLVKPFALAELEARIEALLRRSQPVGESLLRFADLVLDVANARAVRAGQAARADADRTQIAGDPAARRATPGAAQRTGTRAVARPAARQRCPAHAHTWSAPGGRPAVCPSPLIETVRGIGYRLARPVAIKRTPLRQRLVVAFVLLTAAVSGLFSLVTFVAIDELEENLFVSQLDGDLRWWINHLGETPQPRPLTLANQTRLYVTPDMPAAQLPPFLAEQERGWREVFDGNDTYHVVRRDRDGRRYYLVRPASALERRERGWFRCCWPARWCRCWRRSSSRGSSPAACWNRWCASRDACAGPIRRAPPGTWRPALPTTRSAQLARVFEQRLRQLHGFIASERLFTSDVSHELRTPAAIIAGAAETLLARSELLPRARSAVERIASPHRKCRT